MPHRATRPAPIFGSPAAAPERARVGTVWACREYQGLWAAQAVTLLGDQIARVALALLVFDRTRSATASAAAYAVTLLPAVLGGPLLAGIADRHPRRAVMIRCDVACAALTAAVAVPGMPLPVLFGLIFVVSLLDAPFGAARSSLVRDVFPGDDDRYAVATTIGGITLRASQILGFTLGGVLVAVVGVRPALLADAVTFGISAVIVRATVTARPTAIHDREPGHHLLADLRDGARLVFGEPRLRLLTVYAWLAAFHVVPVGLAVPVAAHHAGGPIAAGILLAAPAAGTAAGMIALTVGIRDRKRRAGLIGPLAVLAAAPLIGCATDPPLPVTAVLWAVAGAGTAYQLVANVAFVSAVPDEHRGQAFGLVVAGLLAGQGAAMIAAGAVADAVNPSVVVAAAGVAGTLAALALLPASRTLALPALE